MSSVTYVQRIALQNVAEDTRCPICFTAFECDEVATVSCRCRGGCLMCRDCLAGWVESARRSNPPREAACPTCRAKIDSEQVKSAVAELDLRTREQLLAEDREYDEANFQANYVPDDRDPEVIQQEVREYRIISIGQGNGFSALLQRAQRNFGDEVHAGNVFYTIEGLAGDHILIKALYGTAEIAMPYFFCTTLDTTIATLGILWLRAEYGEDIEFSLNGIPMVRSRWTFNGNVMRWTQTVREVGMGDSSLFEIPQRQMTYMPRRRQPSERSGGRDSPLFIE